MISTIVSRLVILVFGTLYPAYASYKAVRTKNVKEYVKWMMYWIVFALFTCAETFTDVFLSWFPFYYEIKIILVLWLLSPATKGSSILYRKFVHPMLSQREQEIDDYLAKAKEQGYHTVLNLGSKGVNYATNVIMQTAIKGGGGIVSQIRKSYSLSDLSGDSDSRLSHDAVDQPVELRRRSKRSPHRSASERNSKVDMFFSEMDIRPDAGLTHVRSTDDISSGYSSAEPLYGHIGAPKVEGREGLIRTASVGGASRSRTRSTRATVAKKVTIPEGSEREESSADESETEYYTQPTYRPPEKSTTSSKPVNTKLKHSSESDNSGDFLDTVDFSDSNKTPSNPKNIDVVTRNLNIEILTKEPSTNEEKHSITEEINKNNNNLNNGLNTEKNIEYDYSKIEVISNLEEENVDCDKTKLNIKGTNQNDANIIREQCHILLENVKHLTENVVVDNVTEICNISTDIIKEESVENLEEENVLNEVFKEVALVAEIKINKENEVSLNSEDIQCEIIYEEKTLEDEFFEASHVEENDEDDEFEDSDNLNQEIPLTVKYLNTNIKELNEDKEKLKVNLDKEASKSSLDFKVFDELLHRKTLEINKDEQENHKQDFFSAARGGKYNKLSAPIPPEKSNQTDQNPEQTSHPIKATLVLKPGVIKSIPTPAEEPKTIFIHKSPKIKRKSPKPQKHESPISRLMMLPKKLWGYKDHAESSERRKSFSDTDGSREKLNVIFEDGKDGKNLSHSPKYFRRSKKEGLEDSD